MSQSLFVIIVIITISFIYGMELPPPVISHNILINRLFTSIKEKPFWDIPQESCHPYSEWAFSRLLTHGGAKRLPLPKICHAYPTMMKLGRVIPYLTMIQKIYESRDTHLKFCWHHYFFNRNRQILLYQEIQI